MEAKSFSHKNFELKQAHSLARVTSLCESKAQIVQKNLGKASDDSLLLEDSFGPR